MFAVKKFTQHNPKNAKPQYDGNFNGYSSGIGLEKD